MKDNQFYTLQRDGITQGLISTFQVCRQKAFWYLQGYSSKFASMGLTYGSIGHEVLERCYTYIQKSEKQPSSEYVKQVIGSVEQAWNKEHPRADKTALEYKELSLLIAEATIPLYFEYWHKDFKELKWVSLESEFKENLLLPNLNITIPIRGKRDGLFNRKGMWLFETKFKSRIDEEDLVDTLPYNFQNMVYLWATARETKKVPSGVLYNIVRRVGLKQGKNEGMQEFADRCVEDIRSRPEFYFIRLEIATSQKDLEAWEIEFKYMVQDFVNWWLGKTGTYRVEHQCIDKYGRCPYIPLCSGAKRFNLFEKREKVFRELEDY